MISALVFAAAISGSPFPVTCSATHPITQYGSIKAFYGSVSNADQTTVGCIRIGAGGKVGAHPAPTAQLLYVIAGDGRIRTGAERRSIRAGEAVHWAAGAEHESGRDSGMAALVIQAERLDTTPLTRPKEKRGS